MRYLKNEKTNLAPLFPLYKEPLGQKQKSAAQCAPHSRIRAIRATGCARWCAHCARIDFL